MLSVGSRDEGRKRSLVGLEGMGGAKRSKMEENELEEGEAYSGQDDDIDPDDLSYIDVKIQNVLGHFQKEFESGMSAETLGPKFGGYGSFLPAYQRSPPVKLSQPKSPVKVSCDNLSSSPHNLQPENSSVPANASIAKANSASVVQQIEKYGKRDICTSSCSTEGISQHEFTKQTMDISLPKSLKVRIKVGPDNVLIRNKPEIYSDLGLDVSPSPEDSPGGSRELSPESPDAFVESPSTILQVMTHTLVPGNYLLSPLSETLLHLFEKEDISVKNIKKSTQQNVVPENCAASTDTSLHTKDARDFTYKENRSRDKCRNLVQTHGNGMTCEDVMTTTLKNEAGRKTRAVQTVVPRTQDMALSETDKTPMMERAQALDSRKDNHSEFFNCRRMDGSDNSNKEIILSNGKTYSKPRILEKAFEETSGNFNISRKSMSKSQKNLDKKKSDYDSRRMRKNYSAEFEELVTEQPQPAQKACSSENKKMQDKVQSREDGKLIKGNQNEKLIIEPKKEKHSSLISAEPKGMKKTLNLKGAHKSKISRPHKEINKDHNIESRSELLLSAQAQQFEGRTHVSGSSLSTEKSSEKAEVNKVGNFCIAGSATNVQAPLIDSVPKKEVVSAIPAVVLIEDNWVLCDVCQTWRLLPYGTNPESLPGKWQCSMQVWLPGLNNCNISQDEAAKAFHELYQFPAPGIDTNVTAHLSAVTSSITSADTMNPGRKLENVMHNAPINGNKKPASMDATNFPNDSTLTNLPNSSKNLLASSGNKAFNDVSYCTETNFLIKPKPVRTSRSTDLSTEKHIHKQKEKHTAASSYKVGGDSSERSGKYSKPIIKRGTDVDDHRTSKKIKKDGSYHLLKDLHSCVDTSGKIAANGDSKLLTKAPKNILQNCKDHSSTNFKSKNGSSKKPRDEINSSNGKHKRISSGAEAEKPLKYDSNDKKRKLKEQQESQVCQEISMSSEQVTGSRIISKDVLIDGELRKQKKTKVVKSEGKDSCAVTGDGNIEMNGCSTRIALSSNKKHPLDEIDNEGLQAATDEQLLHFQGNVTSGQTLECLDGLKRDVAYMSSLAATTSSSSKVSGSQKCKVNLLETRGSPVESVSSSPMKILSTENNSVGKNSIIKDNVISMGYSGMGSPKRFSDGEFDGSSDQSGTRAKDPSSNGCLRSSEIYRSAESGALDSLRVSHDYEDTETKSLTGVKVIDGRQSKVGKRDVVISSDIGKTNFMCDSGNVHHHPKKYHLERSEKNHFFDEDEHCASDKKNYVTSSLDSREKHRSLNFDSDKGKLKVFDTVTEHKDLYSMRTCNSRSSDAEFDNLKSKKDNLENQFKQHTTHDLRATIAGENRSKPTSQQNHQYSASHEKRQNTSGLLIAEALDLPVVDLGKGMQLSNQAKDKLEKKVLVPQRDPDSINKGGNLEKYPVDAVNSDASKTAKPSRNLDEQNGSFPNQLRQSTASVPRSSSPMKKDGHPNVNIFIKEARDLKHTANRLKNSGLEDESSGIFFESALKFLHAAFLMESPNAESTRQGELVPSTQVLLMYYETAKFCEFCAHEYERLKEMVAAALAYKCAEVAYLKVAYYKHPSASKDRLELQSALDASMPGESPSSSASDVDNLNNQGGIDKVTSSRAVSSPQIAGNHAIAARNRPHVLRLLTYTNYFNCAFEATKKSQNAIAAASTDLGKSGIDMCSARKVLDFNFHNVEGLLRLVRLSMNSIGH